MRKLFVVNFAAPPMIRKVNKYVIPNLNTCNPSQARYRKCRLIFIVFYLAAGTTDTPCEVTFNPSPSEKDISFILNEVKNYLSEDVTVRRGDVLSAWAGIRPLVKDPNKEDTQSLVRNHVIHVSPSGLVTIAGGKWTTYRSMVRNHSVKICKCSTSTIKYI